MKTQDQLTQIGTDWLGPIPKQWDVSKLWELYTYKKERTDKEEVLLSVYRDHGVIPKNSRDDNHNQESEDLSNYLLVRPDDLVINKMKAWQGSVSVSSYRGIVSPAYFTNKLTSVGRQRLNLRYLHHLLRSKMYIETYKRISKGIRPGQWDLDPYQFKVLPVVLPPLDVQKKIAAFLDERTKAIDILVGKKEKLVELLREKRQSLITRIVTKGLDSKSMKSSGVEWLGEIPANWHTDKIISLFDFPNEKVSDKDYEPLSVTYGGVLKQVDDAAKTDNGTNRRLLKVNDIAFNGRSDRQGACGMSDFEGSISVVYHVLRSRSTEVHVRYYHHLFRNTLFSQEFYRWGRGIHDDMWTTRTLEMKKIQVPVPPVSEQQRIANYLDSETLKIDKLASLIESSIKQLREYRRALLYAAVTGKVNF